MQEAKRYEGWNVTHSMPYEVVNGSESDERSSSLYACIPGHRLVKSCKWMCIFMLDLGANRYTIRTIWTNSAASVWGVYDAQRICVNGADSDRSRIVV